MVRNSVVIGGELPAPAMLLSLGTLFGGRPSMEKSIFFTRGNFLFCTLRGRRLMGEGDIDIYISSSGND